jgi:hypothetical protein
MLVFGGKKSESRESQESPKEVVSWSLPPQQALVNNLHYQIPVVTADRQ